MACFNVIAEKLELMVTVPTMEQSAHQAAINHMLPLKAEIEPHMSFSAGLESSETIVSGGSASSKLSCSYFNG
ncbi:hypothetical protein ACEQPO_04905 [Bacillus sp. SL00103]